VKKGRVLVVDDEESIRRAVGRALASRGFLVEVAVDGGEALGGVRSFDPDLVVLDLNLPDVDGLSVCRQIRAWSPVPILVLSVREDETDKVAALDLGADDYLTKPFGTDELLARVRALLRRSGGQGSPGPLEFHSGDLSIDLSSHRISRNGTEIRLTRTEWSPGRGAGPAPRQAAHPRLAPRPRVGSGVRRRRGHAEGSSSASSGTRSRRIPGVRASS
jgi:two-component system KDP operon response regulator KdpE